MAHVLVLGAFDCLHWGHVEFLQRAEKFGKVTVGVTGNELYYQQRARRVLFTGKERQAALETLGYSTIPRPELDASEIFRRLRPDYYVVGNDHYETDHMLESGVTLELLNEIGCTVAYTPRRHSMSTSEIIRRVKAYE